jgi:hypothetical protein
VAKEKKLKYLNFGWEVFESIEDLPVGDLDFIRRTLLFIKASPQLEDPMGLFWMQVLAPWYDRAVFSGLNRTAAVVLYRLSDQVPRPRRASLRVYPKGDNDWYSLEEWRQDFEASFKDPSDIPLVSGATLQLPWL